MPVVGSTGQPYKIILGTSQWDAVNYIRQLTEDTTVPFTIPDSAYQAFSEAVNEDFSRFVSIDTVIGNPMTLSSPLTTQVGINRYVCNTANGFNPAAIRVTDVLYRATNAFSAASEISYLALLPFSPLNRFLFTPNLLDSPTERVLRDEYLGELDHYGKGYYRVMRDPTTGLPAIELYPIPMTAGTPIFVRYESQHAITIDNNQNTLIPSVPEDLKRWWANLLYANVLEQESERFAKLRKAKAGLIDVDSDPRMLENKAQRMRDEVYLALGVAAPAVGISF